MIKFKVGDKVIRKWGGSPFIVHIVDEEAYIGPVLFDVYINKVKAEDCIHFSVYNSSLFHAIQEGEDKRKRK